MPHLISNLIEKAYTPSIARMAPKHLVKKPQLGKLCQELSKFWLIYRQETPKNYEHWKQRRMENVLEVHS